MQDCCELSYNKKYFNSNACRIISDIVELFDPEKFGAWLSKAFEESSFKSFAQLATHIKVSRSTVSRYAGAKDQTLTNKPSQPEPELVVLLANALNKDVNQALILAGHAPMNAVVFDEDEEFSTLFFGSANWSPENRQEAFEYAKLIFQRVHAKDAKEKAELDKKLIAHDFSSAEIMLPDTGDEDENSDGDNGENSIKKSAKL